MLALICKGLPSHQSDQNIPTTLLRTAPIIILTLNVGLVGLPALCSRVADELDFRAQVASLQESLREGTAVVQFSEWSARERLARMGIEAWPISEMGADWRCFSMTGNKARACLLPSAEKRFNIGSPEIEAILARLR